MNHFLLTIITIGAFVVPAFSGDIKTNSIDKSEFKKSFGKICDDSSSSFTCLKMNVAAWMDRVSDTDSLDVFPGVSIVREQNSVTEKTGDITAELARQFPDDPNARIDAFLLKKVSSFFTNHAIKLNFWNNAAENDSVVTARKKDKKGDGGMGMMLAMGAMMKGTLMAIAMGGLAALAGKALMTGLIALLLSAITALKGLSSGGGHSTYEVIAKPVYSASHSHSVAHEGGWDGGNYGHKRSLDQAPLPLGLAQNYIPK
ncbi:uncharacterized protein LOC115891718 [Sitophilus oryzae]|uniref:Uncharacterized protein LOC115891718 n=1 Tax=Sitophilus oryzae TaxID=7048 RepID=A0A6J2YY53_SITOR|nr:uncharacterized protein LOC115891718 [Sitophilus oryzae]